MTACFKRHGFINSIAVDKNRSKGSLVSVLQLDLTNYEHQRVVLQWINHSAVRGVFLAPPCGTASAARQIWLPKESAPEPLRTLEHPDGLPSLTGVDLARVSAANILYSFATEVLELCCNLNKLFMLENPRNSLFWITTVWSESDCAHHLHFQDHQACGYGSKRPKWTRLAANFAEVATVDAVCPGNHQHEAWGIVQQGSKRVFATSLEVHYPVDLCEAIAHAFILRLVAMGLKFNPTPSLQLSAKLATMQQASSTKVPPLVSAYKSRVLTFYFQDQLVWPLTFTVSESCKLLHKFQVGVSVEVQKLQQHQGVLERLESELETLNLDFDLSALSTSFHFAFDSFRIFGVQWEPDEFLQKACEVSHPLSPSLALPLELAQAIESCAKEGVVSIARQRLEFFKLWNKRAKELQTEEASLRRTMDVVVEKAVRGKKLALFKDMLQYYAYPDPGVADELVCGASLIGEVAETGMLPFKFTPALLTPATLETQSKFRRHQIMSEPKGSGDTGIDAEVWKQTLEERDRGWLIGPLKDDEVPEGAPISKRFGLRQKHKVRLIDDFSESSVNQAVMVTESPVLHTVDVACAALAYWFSLCSEMGTDPALVARTFDLSSAYRQVGLNHEGRSVGYVRVYNPDMQCWTLFQAQVLPFGAVKSVHSFLRLARSIWWLGVVGCRLMWSSFYDDYIVFSAPALSKSTELTAGSLFKLLGWIFAEEGRKSKPFDLQCEALGVLFDLAGSNKGICRIANTAARVEEISTEIHRLIQQGHVTQIEAQKLRGRMQFAESQIYGRTGKRCIGILKDFACRRRTNLLEREAMFLKLFVSLLKSEEPRQVMSEHQKSIVIFTDACYEKDSRDRVCGLGGILCDPFLGTNCFFSCQLDAGQRALLGEPNRKQIIFEAETLCAVLAYNLWETNMTNRKSFLYVDNEGTKFCLIRGRSDNLVVDAIAGVFAEVETHVRTVCWISRVSSYSNIADGPSRGDLGEMKRLKFTDVSSCAESCLKSLCKSVEMKMGKKANLHSPKTKMCASQLQP